jgi:hypothetical protein
MPIILFELHSSMTQVLPKDRDGRLQTSQSLLSIACITGQSRIQLPFLLEFLLTPYLFYSGALLLPDGSVFVSGSNPNPDYIVGDGVQYPWEDRVERFYPWYYDKRRPEPQGLPTTITYGGDYFDVKLTKQDLEDVPANIKNTKAVIIRTGFSTHAFNMGQRVLQLRSAYTVADDGSATLHVSQLPSNANVFQPGPAMLFITVNGVPSVAQWIMVGSGQIEEQPLHNESQLPDSFIPSNLDGETTSHHNGAFQEKTLAGGLVALLALSSVALLL